MGCDKYLYNATYITIPEDADADCLCTFPHNDQQHLYPGRLRSLAYLGAAVKLIHEGHFDNQYMYIPKDLPDWIVEGINKTIPQ